MKPENIENLLTIIITNDNLKVNNKNFFAYPNINNVSHNDTIDYFISQANLDLKNVNTFDTSLEIAKMGNIILYNVVNTDYLLIFCPDLKKLTPYQKVFINFIEEYIIENQKIVNLALYHEDTDTFSEHYIDDPMSSVSNKQKTIDIFK